MLKKLGFYSSLNEAPLKHDNELMLMVDNLFETMNLSGSEFTKTFRIFIEIHNTFEFDKNLQSHDQNILQDLIKISAPKDFLLSKRKPKV